MSLEKARFEKIKEEVLGKAINYRKELARQKRKEHYGKE